MTRERTVAGDAQRRRPGPLEQLGRRKHGVAQPDAQRLVGADRVAGQDQLLGLADADPPGQALGAAETRDHAELHLRLAEAGGRRGVDEVAGERELAASPEREAVDRGDPRQVRVLHGQPERRAPAGQPLGRVLVHLAHLGDVGAGDERLLTGAGHDHRAEGPVLLERAGRVEDLGQDRARQRVQGLLAPDGQERDRPVDLDRDVVALARHVAPVLPVLVDPEALLPCASYT